MLDCSNWSINTVTGLNRGIPSSGPGYWTDGTGAPDPNTPGTSAETCLNWSSTAGTTRVGRAPASAGNFFDTNGTGNACTNSWGLYCVEQ